MEEDIRLEMDEKADLRAVTSLAGAINFDRKKEGEAIEWGYGKDGGVRISANKLGVSQLTVSFGKASRQIDIVVEGEEAEQ